MRESERAGDERDRDLDRDGRRRPVGGDVVPPRLTAKMYLPDGDGPFAALLEALPYRKDDLTASYRDSYVRFADEAGFAVCRLDLRGTGSSGGTATDEYPDAERSDLRAVIEWLATQPWSSGRVGMFGTSYSGFNSLHMAAEGVPELGAVVAMYATDDRYTDDVHYHGGVLRAIDLIDYVHYMVPMNALPPVPALWGDGWEDEWRRRVDETPAWLLDWLREQADSAMWRRGSIRLGPGDAGLRAPDVPDDAHRRLGRRLPQQHVPHDRAAACAVAPAGRSVEPQGPGPGRARARTSTPTPRSSPSSTSTSAMGHRRPTRRRRCSCAGRSVPSPTWRVHDGVWRDLAAWPPPGLRWVEYTPLAVAASTPSTDRRARRCVATSAWRRGSRAPVGCRGASRSTSAPTTPGR